MYDVTLCETIRLTGFAGEMIEAYAARPLSPQPRGGVVVFHHVPGYDPGTKEIVRRFAVAGYNAICPNLHYCDAPGGDWVEQAAANRENGGVPDDQFLGDAQAAIDWLRSQTSANGRVGTIGYCSGGRHSFLAGCCLPVDAVIDCYGNFTAVEPPPGRRYGPVLDQAENLHCPLLGLFGANDVRPSPDEVATIARRLTDLGKPHEIHIYEDVGHAFFSVNQKNYRVEAANDGWEKIFAFYERHLTA